MGELTKGAGMKRFNEMGQVLRLFLVVGLIGLTGCQNGNLLGKLHDSGDSSNTETLLSDGNVALDNGDYAAALGYFQRVLDNDSDNSLALYGAATASAGLSGLNLGQLLANVLNKNGTVTITSLGEAIQAHSTGYGSLAAGPNSIVRNISVVQTFLREAGAHLYKIIQGQADGKIRQNDIGALLDCALIYLVVDVVEMIEADVFDIINDNGRLKFVSKTGAAAYCSDPQNANRIGRLAAELGIAYAAVDQAAIAAGIGASTITRLRNDLDSFLEEGLDGDGTDDLDAACRTALSNQGFTAATFRDYISL